MSAASAVQSPAPSSPLPFRAIERRDASELSYERYVAEYVDRNRPVILSNSAPQWNAMRAWTPAFFRERFGAQTVNVSYQTKMPMAELIDAILASTPEQPGPYLHKVLIYRDMPELLADLSPDNVYSFPRRYAGSLMPRRFQRPDGFLKLLIGGAGGKFPLMHYDTDNSHAMITEIYGDKEFLLFPPEDTKYVYPCENSDHTSMIENPDKADLSRFPLFAQATQYRGTVYPGDSILIPSAWWHAARALNPSISVCTNMMYRSNWPGFIDQACDPAVVRNPLNRAAKRAYLTGLGTVLTACEGLQKAMPSGPLAAALSRWAPLYRRELPTEVAFPAGRLRPSPQS